jgi:hypothetical protein
MQLIAPDQKVSEPFVVPKGGEVTVVADGLQGADRVAFYVVSTTSSTASNDPCCPGVVALPEVKSRVPLKRECNCVKQLVELTADDPWAVINTPQMVQLQAEVYATDDAVIEVTYFETLSI